MQVISESEFAGLCSGIHTDRDSIVLHNPFGTADEVLLWMLLNCLVSYLSLDDVQTPCFNGKPDAQTYRDAIRFVLRGRRSEVFDADLYIDRMLEC